MPWLEAFALAFANIRAQKLKSFLTVLGVCIGVMFLVAVVAIVDGMGRYMEEDLIGKTIGINTFELRRRPSINVGEVDRAAWLAYERRPVIVDQDVRPVVEALPEGTRWAAYIEDRVTLTSPFSRPRSATLRAVDGDYFIVKNVELAGGRAFTPQELAYGSPAIVLGADLARRLFPGLDPLGRAVTIGGSRYTVVGVGVPQGSVFGASLDNFAIAPLRTPVRHLLHRQSHQIDAVAVQAAHPQLLPDLQDRVRAVMRTRHQLAPREDDNFAVESADSALEFWNNIKRYLVLAGIALPAVGLIVGAIVIMNIMLVAVAERTYEIGIRKALGARRSDILAQFLIESATLSIVGAGVGILLGAVAAAIVRIATPMPATVAPWSVAIGLLLGGGVGVVSGMYPASRASRLDPVAALRAE